MMPGDKGVYESISLRRRRGTSLQAKNEEEATLF
jgi:hypothetical protein